MTEITDPTGGIAMRPPERRAIAVIAGVSMLRMLGLFALLPVVAVYAASFEGATPMLVGLAVGAYGLTQAALQVPLGALSDRVGRIPVIVGGLVMFAIGSAVAGLADSITGLLIGRFLQGAGAISATLVALVADAIRVEVRTRAMAIYGVGFGLSFLVAIALGPWVAAHFGVPALFGLAVLLAFASMLMLLALPRDIEKPAQLRTWEFGRALRPDLLRLDAYIFLLHVILTASFVGLPFLLGKNLGLAATSQWTLYGGAILLSLAGTIPLILWDERRGRRRSVSAAVGLLIVGELLLTFAAFSYTSVLLALAVFFAGFNFLEASLPSRVSAVADDDARGVSLGVFSTAQFLGIFVGGLLGGRFLEASEPGDIFLVCALVGGIWLAVQGFGAPARQR